MARLAAALLCAAGAAATSDTEALVQHSLATHSTSNLRTSLLEGLLVDSNRTLRSIAALAQEQSRQMFRKPETKEALAAYARQGANAWALDQTELIKGWQEFKRQATSNVDARPEELLRKAKASLMQTGAWAEMKKLALQSRVTTKGAVPLDSMTVGFYTSLAPWNNVLQSFSFPLIKTRFTLFSNFFGPEGNAARLCIGASLVVDSTYGVHSRAEFGGVGIFVGPAKWDNVPGWNFGAGGGIDDLKIFDVADFHWTWTLSEVPETVGFHFFIHLMDHEQLHASALQESAKVVTENPPTYHEVQRHGSTWIEHAWCSPDWDDTPLVIAPAPSPSGKKGSAPRYVAPQKAAMQAAALKANPAEEWDPANDAV